MRGSDRYIRRRANATCNHRGGATGYVRPLHAQLANAWNFIFLSGNHLHAYYTYLPRFMLIREKEKRKNRGVYARVPWLMARS